MTIISLRGQQKNLHMMTDELCNVLGASTLDFAPNQVLVILCDL